MPARRPTPEQEAAVEAFRRGDDLVLQAGAGTGKTTTLKMLGRASPWRGRYLAFNRMIAREAQRTFPGNMTCSTAHKLAHRAVGHRFQERLDRPRMATAKLAQLHLLLATTALVLLLRAPKTLPARPAGRQVARRGLVSASSRRFTRVLVPLGPWLFGWSSPRCPRTPPDPSGA